MAGKFTTMIAKSNPEDPNTNEASQAGTFDRAASQSNTTETHLSDYLLVLKKHKWIFLSVFVLIVGGVSTATFLAVPKYEATVQLLLGGQPTPMNPLGDTPQRMPEINLYQQTQINLLSSRSLARKVIQELDLNDRFSALKKPHPIMALVKKFFGSEKKTKQSFLIPDETNAADQQLISPKIIDWYVRHLSVNPIRNSSLVTISFIGPDPELITEIANTHAQAAIKSAVDQHKSQAVDALDWLKAQIAEQRKDVESSRRAIYEFKKQHNALSLEDSQIIFSQELQELNTALIRARSDRIAKQATYLELQDIIKNKDSLLTMPEISRDPVIQNLRTQLVEMMANQIEFSTKYGPKHPKMIELTNGIKQIRREIDNEQNRLVKAIKAELDTATEIENSILRSLKKQKQFAMSLGEQAIEYDVLKQQAESSQDIYDFLLKQSEELGLSSAISSSNMHIVDQAEVPVDPVSPRNLLNIMIAIFTALFFGAGLVFFLEYLDNTVKTPLDVAVKLGLPVLGMIPLHKSFKRLKTEHDLIEQKPDPANKDSLPPIYHISNRLPDKLRSPADGLFGRALIIESVTMGEGKTTVLSQIASNLTEAGLRVLLMDCDFQRPTLDKLFNISRNGGLGKSIDRIMSHHLSRGTLDSYSMGDLFFLIALKKKSGQLSVQNEDQRLIAYFQNGVLIHIQNPESPEYNRIGTMLRNGGFITDEQLQDALQRHQRTAQPMGYILVNAGYIGRDKMRGPLRLQIEEYIQKMFSWKKGRFSFKPGVASIYENEKIFFLENYTSMINNLARIETSKFIEKALFENIHSLKQENLYLLPAGSSYRLIGSLNQILMKKILEKLKQHFDVLLIDTPPLDAASGIESIFPLSDGMILVVKAGHLSIKVLNGALNHLPQDKIIGTILNQVKMAPNVYYY